MGIQRCFICEQILTEQNASDEHIILNALGGHIRSRQLLCKSCNEWLGQKADAELAKELEFCASYLDIPRQRGENQRIETEREEPYNLLPGGKPEMKRPQFTKKEQMGKLHIELVSRNEAEARRILGDLKKKYPGIDVEQAMQQAVRRKEYLGKKIHMSVSFKGKEIFPSIVKTAVEFYLWKGGDRAQIAHLIPYITGEQEQDVCWYFYPEEPVIEEKDNEILHVIHVCGNAEEQILYAYVSLFGVIQCMILLNDTYQDDDFQADYVYEVNRAEEETYVWNFRYHRQEVLQAVCDRNPDWTEGLKRAYQNYLNKASAILRSRVSDRILHEAVENSFGKYPENIPMTQEMLFDFLKELEKEFYPWLASQM